MTGEEILQELRNQFNLQPKELLLRLLFGEARGEPIEAQVGVGSVVRTRAKRRREYPSEATWTDVMLAPFQFSCFLPGDPNLPKLLFLKPEGDPYLLAQLWWVASGIVDGGILDNVAGATHYYDFSVIVGRGQQRDSERLRRYLQAVELILTPPAEISFQQRDQVDQAKDLIHILVKDLPPKWDDEVLPCARKGRLVFFKL